MRSLLTWLAACLLLGSIATACKTESYSARCSQTSDCPGDQECIGNICVVRLDATSPTDTGQELPSDQAEPGDLGRDTPMDPADLTADLLPPDTSTETDTQPPPDAGTDPDSPPPCDDLPEICDGRDNDCDGWTDEDSVCEDVDLGIRIELSWDATAADLDLHFLNKDGVLGSQTLDPNDCYWNNLNPEWSNPHSLSDNPLHSGDVHQGSAAPETVLLPQPTDEPYRILVYYASRSGMMSTPVNAEVRIYFDDDLAETLTVDPTQFPDVGYYWNVACLNYPARSLRPLEEITHRPDTPQPNACGGNSCENLCDCAQGHACQTGQCTSEVTGDYCCDNSHCPLTYACTFADGGNGLCGGQIDFDTDLDGNSLAVDLDVQELYLAAGVRFSTDRSDAVVCTNPYELRSRSEGNSCATKDNNPASGSGYWLGNVRATFLMPGPGDPTQAATRSVELYLGQTWPGGLSVDFFDTAGELLATRTTDSAGTDFIQVSSDTPIGSLDVRPAGGYLSDPDLTIDDLTFGPLFLP
ncbi:MAG: hypothetical protein JW797_19450 [Bradymonadales bacterium]|nr:hypothetical protein [Bradymonadales bacterium]